MGERRGREKRWREWEGRRDGENGKGEEKGERR